MIFDLSRLKDLINDKFYPLLKNKDRYLIIYGSAGSGKSHFIAQKILVRILVGIATGKKHKFIALRKTQPAVRKSVFALFCKYVYEWGIQDWVTINKQEMTLDFYGGSQIICLGLDDPEKLKSIEGVTGAWLEEATEFSLLDFTQIDLRIRGKSDSYKQLICSFNPVSRENWVFSRFFEKDLGKCTLHHSTYKDNKYIDEEYKQVLEDLKGQDKVLYDIYGLGEWGVLQGLIYTNWDIVDSFPDNCDEIMYGLDFGFNNPTALIKVGIKDIEDIYIEEEIYETHLTNPDLISKLEALGIDRDKEIKADSAEPDRIQEIRNAGFCINPAKKGKDSVKNGIDVVKRKKLHIVRDSSNVLKEARSYKWKEDKDGKLMDEPVKFLDHSLDALRYAIGEMQVSELKISSF